MQLRSALDALGGNVMATVDMLMQFQEQEGDERAAWAAMDAELAQQLQEEQEATAAEAEASTHACNAAPPAARPPLGMQARAGRGAGGGTLEMLKLSALALEERDSARGEGPSALPPAATPVRRSSARRTPAATPTATVMWRSPAGVLEEPAAVQELRALFRKAPAELLHDTLSNCGGDVAMARAALQSMGLCEEAALVAAPPVPSYTTPTAVAAPPRGPATGPTMQLSSDEMQGLYQQHRAKVGRD